MSKKIAATAVASAMVLLCLACTLTVHAAETVPSGTALERKADSASPAQEMEGNWGGTLAGSLRLVLHVRKTPAGHYAAVLESVDQGHSRIPVDTLEATADRLAFSVAAIHGSYNATWDKHADAWVGTWSQTQDLPLTLTRVTGEVPQARRPQEAAIENGSLPYMRQTVTFENAAAHVKLAGTFSAPEGKGPFPAVVLIAGSGPQTRDEEVVGHKVFLVLSDYLNRRGIAVLRFDKRGIGESGGNFGTATTADFTTDTEAAVTYLKGRPDVDARHIGLIGHSEGGEIAPAVATQDSTVGFIVLLAGPAIRGDKLLAQQIYLIGKASGVPEDRGAVIRNTNEQIFTAIAAAPNASEAKMKAESMLNQAFDDHKIWGDRDKAKANLNQLVTPWMRYFLAYDPVPTLRQVKVPVLALNGSLDLQVPPKEDLAAIKDALKGDNDVTVMELPKLNHLFQAASTGSPAEYETIEETIDTSALQIVGDWIAAHTQ